MMVSFGMYRGCSVQHVQLDCGLQIAISQAVGIHKSVPVVGCPPSVSNLPSMAGIGRRVGLRSAA